MRIDHNATEVGRAIELHGDRVGVRAQQTIGHFTLLLQAAVKRHASQPRVTLRGPGMGGPRLITGDYNRSITARVGVLWGDVGTDKPQGRRLEFGFEGVDALGRYYDQPPYPHFGPALDEIEVPYIAALSLIALEGW